MKALSTIANALLVAGALATSNAPAIVDRAFMTVTPFAERANGTPVATRRFLRAERSDNVSAFDCV